MSDMLSRFSSVLSSVTEQEIKADPTLQGRMTLYDSGGLSIFYAPFEYIQPSAKVIIAGITPGLQQAGNSLAEARRQILAGKGQSEALRAAKVFASFSGPMRTNLVAMLDHIGLQKWIGVEFLQQPMGWRTSSFHIRTALSCFVGWQKLQWQPPCLHTGPRQLDGFRDVKLCHLALSALTCRSSAVALCGHQNSYKYQLDRKLCFPTTGCKR